jgi:uncharacterized protein (DUF58 family)
METHLVPGARFVDPKVLARVKDLELLARTVVDGFINGLHRAPHFGASVDFAEHRGYVAGDDIRRVDWRLFARTDKYYIKQYDADTNANLTILFDVSKSMRFMSEGVSKLEYGKFLAACLGYLSHRQRDRVGIATFDEDVVSWVPASAKHFHVLLHTIDRATADRPGRLIANLERIIERLKRRSIVILISDLYEDPELLVDVLKPYRFGGHDMAVFHVLDPAEISFPYDQPSRFVDLESGEEVPVVPDKFADEYRRLVQEHITALSTRCTDARIDYTLLRTTDPLDEALFSYLGNRERLMRTR